ncbi:MAG: hypothetical protein Q4G50_10345 [Corynebacterium sp.]|uniref:hypothetical protein n=1 Tax=Corynebacterium sp. TaxID=1720 RepID=UPI0026DF1383|nr:hypothetical protein [Corynebacterium sp.]MDO5670394.1 hypothetical protein [Corynebacterium sp.]
MSKKPTFRTWDDYFIPGTSVLRNKLSRPGHPYGEPNPAALEQLESSLTSFRLSQLAANPIQGSFDYAHLKALHSYIFQDVYDWAGEERVAPVDRFMTKNGYAYYPAGPELRRAVERQFRLLAEKDALRGLTGDTFVTELAEI